MPSVVLVALRCNEIDYVAGFTQFYERAREPYPRAVISLELLSLLFQRIFHRYATMYSNC